jgi:16S rRNA (guanine527-N7)-methyltransferase
VSEAEQLIRDARALGVELDAAQAAAQCRLLDELAHWNRSFNLTAITERREMLTHHLLDSLSILPFLAGECVLDIGTGAGFPGLPLAIAAPQRRFVLLDSNGKKIRFVAHAVRTLGLRNVEAVHARAGGREMAGTAAPRRGLLQRRYAAAGYEGAASGRGAARPSRALAHRSRA